MSKSIDETNPCYTCPKEKKIPCWSKWGTCPKWIEWSDRLTAIMNEALKNDPDFIRHMNKINAENKKVQVKKIE